MNMLPSNLKFLRFKLLRKLNPSSRVYRLIDYIFTFLLSFGATKKLRKAYLNYLNGGISSKNAADLIINSNFRTKGRLRNVLTDKANSNLDLTTFDSLPQILPQFDTAFVAQELLRTGFTKLPVKLPIEFIDQLYSFALSTKVKPTKYASDQSLQVSPNPDIDHIWDVPFEDVVSSKYFQLLLQDQQLMKVAAVYLNSNPVVIGGRLYWSIKGKSKEFLTPENWHVDAGDGLKFVKVFVALTDVSIQSGPTGFIEGTCKTLPRKYFSGRRFHENEIEKDFSGRIINATGPVGTVYMVDTRGLHRGTPVESGVRLLAHFLYGTDFFGSPRPTTYSLPSSCCFGDKYTGDLKRSFLAYRSDSPTSTAEINGP
jgi:hypothetical protein